MKKIIFANGKGRAKSIKRMKLLYPTYEAVSGDVIKKYAYTYDILTWLEDHCDPETTEIHMGSIMDLGETVELAQTMYSVMLDDHYHVIFEDDPWANTYPIITFCKNTLSSKLFCLNKNPKTAKEYSNNYYSLFQDTIGRSYDIRLKKRAEFRNKMKKANANRLANGEPVGRQAGKQNLLVAELQCINVMLTVSRFFGGKKQDKELIKLTVSKKTYYIYKKKATKIWNNLSQKEQDEYKKRDLTEHDIELLMNTKMSYEEKMILARKFCYDLSKYQDDRAKKKS